MPDCFRIALLSIAAVVVFAAITTPAQADGLSISGVTPNRGPAAGGGSIAISGSGFTGVTGVYLDYCENDAVTSFSVLSDSLLTAVMPAHAPGVVIVEVWNGPILERLTEAYTFVAAPTVTALAPATGATAGGTSVVITGTGLSGAASVTFGGTAATSFTVDSATQITAIAPAHDAGPVDVGVTTDGGTGTSTAAFTFVAPPQLPAAAPAAAPKTFRLGGVRADSSATAATALSAQVTSPGAGIFTITGTAPAGGGLRTSRVTVCSARVTVRGAVTTTLACPLGDRAWASLHRRSLRVAVVVTFTPAGGERQAKARFATLKRFPRLPAEPVVC